MDRSNLVAIDPNFVRDKFERDDPDFAIGGLGWRMDGCKTIRADVFGIVCGVCLDDQPFAWWDVEAADSVNS